MMKGLTPTERRYPHNIFSKEQLLVFFGFSGYDELLDRMASSAIEPIYEGPNNYKYVIACNIEEHRDTINARFRQKIAELELKAAEIRQEIREYKKLIYEPKTNKTQHHGKED